MSAILIDASQLGDFIKDAIEDGFKNYVAEYLKESKNLTSVREKNTEILLDRRSCAELLQVSLTTLHKWCVNGIVPSYKINSRIRFKREEIMNLVETNRLEKFKHKR